MEQHDYIQYLENRITILEQENIETTNTLYEIENRLQAQIDALIHYTMELKDWAQPNDVF